MCGIQSVLRVGFSVCAVFALVYVMCHATTTFQKRSGGAHDRGPATTERGEDHNSPQAAVHPSMV